MHQSAIERNTDKTGPVFHFAKHPQRESRPKNKRYRNDVANIYASHDEPTAPATNKPPKDIVKPPLDAAR